mgnify:FL=1
MADPAERDRVDEGSKIVEGSSGADYVSVKILGPDGETDYVIPNVDEGGIVFTQDGG